FLKLFREALSFQKAEENIAGGRSIAQPEFLDRFHRHPALLEIPEGVPALIRIQQDVMVQPAGPFEGFAHPLPRTVLGVGNRSHLGEGNCRLLRQAANSFHKGQLFHLHDEFDDVPPLPAAEAVIDLLLRGYGKGGGLFGMKGTQAEVISPAFLELYISPYNVYDVVMFPDAFDDLFGNRPPFHRYHRFPQIGHGNRIGYLPHHLDVIRQNSSNSCRGTEFFWRKNEARRKKGQPSNPSSSYLFYNERWFSFQI